MKRRIKNTTAGRLSSNILKVAAALILTLSTTNIYAQTESEYEKYVREQKEKYNKAIDKEQKAYDDYVIKSEAEYKAYEKKMKAEYEDFCKRVMAKWGDKEAVQSSEKVWVEYSEDLSERSIVNFETGSVTVEVILEGPEDAAAVEEKLAQSVEKSVNSTGKTTNYVSEYIKQEPLSEKPILKDIIDLNTVVKAKESVTAKAKEAKAAGLSMLDKIKNYLSEAKQTIVTKLNSEGKEVKVATVELKLAEGYVSDRAAQFKDIIKKYSNKHAISEPLIYSIMEQESAFNPAAKSWVPAYGLMQLVPTSGGRDSYKYVYKEDKIPTPTFLYKPDNNVNLGTAYLKILKTTSFAKVTDPDCQLLCMIAAYNCGAGNVSRAIIGSTNLPKAIPYINEMSYDKLYSTFRTKLPKETQDYVYKVTNNMKKYSGKK